MLETSFFDILVNVFIHRRISKMLIAIFSPFLNSQTADEVKEKLKQEGKLPATVYKALFRKGIMNNMSTGMKSIMVPIKEPTLAKQLRRGATIVDIPQESLKIIEDQTPNVAEIMNKSSLDTGRANSLDAIILPVGNKPIEDDYHEIVSDQRNV